MKLYLIIALSSFLSIFPASPVLFTGEHINNFRSRHRPPRHHASISLPNFKFLKSHLHRPINLAHLKKHKHPQHSHGTYTLNPHHQSHPIKHTYHHHEAHPQHISHHEPQIQHISHHEPHNTQIHHHEPHNAQIHHHEPHNSQIHHHEPHTPQIHHHEPHNTQIHHHEAYNSHISHQEPHYHEPHHREPHFHNFHKEPHFHQNHKNAHRPPPPYHQNRPQKYSTPVSNHIVESVGENKYSGWKPIAKPHGYGQNIVDHGHETKIYPSFSSTTPLYQNLAYNTLFRDGVKKIKPHPSIKLKPDYSETQTVSIPLPPELNGHTIRLPSSIFYDQPPAKLREYFQNNYIASQSEDRPITSKPFPKFSPRPAKLPVQENKENGQIPPQLVSKFKISRPKLKFIKNGGGANVGNEPEIENLGFKNPHKVTLGNKFTNHNQPPQNYQNPNEGQFEKGIEENNNNMNNRPRIKHLRTRVRVKDNILHSNTNAQPQENLNTGNNNGEINNYKEGGIYEIAPSNKFVNNGDVSTESYEPTPFQPPSFPIPNFMKGFSDEINTKNVPSFQQNKNYESTNSIQNSEEVQKETKDVPNLQNGQRGVRRKRPRQKPQIVHNEPQNLSPPQNSQQPYINIQNNNQNTKQQYIPSNYEQNQKNVQERPQKINYTPSTTPSLIADTFTQDFYIPKEFMESQSGENGHKSPISFMSMPGSTPQIIHHTFNNYNQPQNSQENHSLQSSYSQPQHQNVYRENFAHAPQQNFVQQNHGHAPQQNFVQQNHGHAPQQNFVRPNFPPQQNFGRDNFAHVPQHQNYIRDNFANGPQNGKEVHSSTPSYVFMNIQNGQAQTTQQPFYYQGSSENNFKFPPQTTFRPAEFNPAHAQSQSVEIYSNEFEAIPVRFATTQLTKNEPILSLIGEKRPIQQYGHHNLKYTAHAQNELTSKNPQYYTIVSPTQKSTTKLIQGVFYPKEHQSEIASSSNRESVQIARPVLPQPQKVSPVFSTSTTSSKSIEFNPPKKWSKPTNVDSDRLPITKYKNQSLFNVNGTKTIVFNNKKKIESLPTGYAAPAPLIMKNITMLKNNEDEMESNTPKSILKGMSKKEEAKNLFTSTSTQRPMLRRRRPGAGINSNLINPRRRFSFNSSSITNFNISKNEDEMPITTHRPKIHPSLESPRTTKTEFESERIRPNFRKIPPKINEHSKNIAKNNEEDPMASAGSEIFEVRDNGTTIGPKIVTEPVTYGESKWFKIKESNESENESSKKIEIENDNLDNSDKFSTKILKSTSKAPVLNFESLENSSSSSSNENL